VGFVLNRTEVEPGLFWSGKLLLVLSNEVILGSESRVPHDHILLSHYSGSRASLIFNTVFLLNRLQNTGHISQETHHVSPTKTIQLMPFRETIAVHS
jgi:hypothetical protein